jgi:hypothetical protein
MSTSAMFATDSWTSDDETGFFTADIICTPTLDVAEGTNELGEFFNDGTLNTITASADYIEWSLTGEADRTYEVTFSNSINGDLVYDGLGSGIKACQEFNTSGSDPWQVSLNGDDGTIDRSACVLYGDMSTSYDDANAMMTCTDAINVRFTPTGIMIPTTEDPGTDVTFTVSVTSAI